MGGLKKKTYFNNVSQQSCLNNLWMKGERLYLLLNLLHIVIIFSPYLFP